MVSSPWGWVFSAAETLPVGETGGSKGMGAAGEGDHPPEGPRSGSARDERSEARKTGETPGGGGPLGPRTLPRARGGAPEQTLAASAAGMIARQGWKPGRAETACGFGSRQPARALLRGDARLDKTGYRPLYVLMVVETLKDALAAGWRVHARCIGACADGTIVQVQTARTTDEASLVEPLGRLRFGRAP